MNVEETIKNMTFEEKAKLLSGCGMTTFPIDRLGIAELRFSDGPHGVRTEKEKNCVHFPALCTLGSTWSVETAYNMGSALADECIKNGIDILLGPGINIKRHILCGRNFEYLSEDPLLSGEIAAAYIKGLQDKGVSACLKHYAANNQEENRLTVSAEIDERTLREIYLKGFEIAVKKANPDSVMCAYNKVNAVWCSENIHLIKDILKDEWGYEGLMVSDWGAVQNISRAVHAGLDLQMSSNPKICEQLAAGLENGVVTMEEIDEAVKRMLKFTQRNSCPQTEYNRDEQHKIVSRIAADGTVLLKNEKNVLPISSQKYKKVAVVGEFAVSPLIGGQGSAEVLYDEKYIDSPLEKLKNNLPDVEFKYIELYKKREYSDVMLWLKSLPFQKEIEDCDLVVFFAGAMVSEDTEYFDRRSAMLNQNYEMFMKNAIATGKKTAVVLQNGGALIFGSWLQKCDAVVEMWLGGEAAGSAIADVLCGRINPSGKLSETFPKCMRTDLEYPGSEYVVEYKERFDVGYRYYDKHPEEILYSFGHGLSYTEFEYKDISINPKDMKLEFVLKNTGSFDGAEVWQLYIGDPVSTVIRPVKELKKFGKVFLHRGEEKKIEVSLTEDDLSYYNTVHNMWVAENGRYDIYIGSSSRDIRLKARLDYIGNMPYSIQKISEDMIG